MAASEDASQHFERLKMVGSRRGASDEGAARFG